MTEVLSFAKTGTWCLAHSNWKEEKKKTFSTGLMWRLTNKSVLIHIDSTKQPWFTQPHCHPVRPQGLHDSWLL